MAVGDAYVFPGFLTPVLTLLFFQSHRLLFSHASAEVRGENTPERKVASTWDRTHNHQVMSPTRSPLSHPGGYTAGVFVEGTIVWNQVTFTVQCRLLLTLEKSHLLKRRKCWSLAIFHFSNNVYYHVEKKKKKRINKLGHI